MISQPLAATGPACKSGLCRAFLAGLLSMFLFASAVPAADWPFWRGPTRDGHTTESSQWLKEGWLPKDPSWRASVGVGASSPIIVDGNAYLFGHENGKDVLRCLSTSDGTERWKVSNPCGLYGRFHEGDEGIYSGPSSTPEYDPAGKLIYTLGADGHLIARDTQAEGKLVWSRNLYDGFQVGKRPKLTRAPLRDYGYTTSPLVHGDWLLVEVGSTKHGSVIAFDKKTGKQVWASELRDEAGHTGGMSPMRIEGIDCIAVVTQRNLAVIRLDGKSAGKTVGLFPWITDFANTIASPAVQGDCVLVTAAYNHNAMCKVRFSLTEVKEVWRQKFPSKVCTPVIHKDRVYVAWQKVRCLDWKTGEQEWEGGVFGDPGSCLVTSDDRLIVFGKNGKLSLLETAGRSPDKYLELTTVDGLFRAAAWPHVALADGRLFCRDREGNLSCFKLPVQK